uniref:Lipoprotein n=1 Tax=Arundo donax TaxID=35708 RepID=A0A0A9AH22_ARUDO
MLARRVVQFSGAASALAACGLVPFHGPAPSSSLGKEAQATIIFDRVGIGTASCAAPEFLSAGIVCRSVGSDAPTFSLKFEASL